VRRASAYDLQICRTPTQAQGEQPQGREGRFTPARLSGFQRKLLQFHRSPDVYSSVSNNDPSSVGAEHEHEGLRYLEFRSYGASAYKEPMPINILFQRNKPPNERRRHMASL